LVEKVIAIFEAKPFADILEAIAKGPADADRFFGESKDLPVGFVKGVFGTDPTHLVRGEVPGEQGVGVDFDERQNGAHRIFEFRFLNLDWGPSRRIRRPWETVETVPWLGLRPGFTQLKQGVNEKGFMATDSAHLELGVNEMAFMAVLVFVWVGRRRARSDPPYSVEGVMCSVWELISAD
jgi:hypothetical protein